MNLLLLTVVSVFFNPTKYSVREGQTVNITLSADKVAAIDFYVLVSLEDISAMGKKAMGSVFIVRT